MLIAARAHADNILICIFVAIKYKLNTVVKIVIIQRAVFTFPGFSRVYCHGFRNIFGSACQIGFKAIM